MKIKVVWIEWEDATFEHDWEFAPEVHLARSWSAGILVAENKDGVSIAPCFNDMEAISNRISIPKSCIKSMKVIYEHD